MNGACNCFDGLWPHSGGALNSAGQWVVLNDAEIRSVNAAPQASDLAAFSDTATGSKESPRVVHPKNPET